MLLIPRHLCFSVSLFFMIFALVAEDSNALEDSKSNSTLITNVVIYDGSGDDPFNGSVEYSGEVIVEVFRHEVQSNGYQTIIDGDGLALAPGFIDTHSHHDLGIDEEPMAVAAVTQGITTIVRAVDGFSDSPPSKTSISSRNEYFSIKEFKK